MKIKTAEQYAAIGLAVISGFAAQACKTQIPKKLPNILWIVSEDNSAYFTGCYGNSFATTPNIDKLAGKGFLYTHAYCTNAVSAPSRNTIITGVYASSNGNENMRSSYAISSAVHTYPEYLRKAGYYCTNNSKTDYNTSSIIPSEIWDESSNTAHYKNRPEGKPFFAVFNLGTSHESSIHKQTPTEDLRHDPSKVILPPYHPDTPEMRHDWAQYYDKIEDMDAEVGALLKELEESGEAETNWMRKIRDVGVIPETEYKNFAGKKSMYDYMRSADCPFDELMKAADLATLGGKSDLNTFIQYLKNKNSAIRYWGATGLLILKDDAKPAIPALKEASGDKSGAVATFAAEALYGLGEKELSRKIYIHILQDTAAYDMNDQNFALNSIDAINDNNPDLIAAVQQLFKELGSTPEGLASYPYRTAEWLFKKWGIK